MRGGALSQLAAAFRIRQLVVGSSELSGGTAKRALSDQADVGRSRHVDMLRCAVDALFSQPYLAARGLVGRDALEHNDLVSQAADALLTRWDQVSSLQGLLAGFHKIDLGLLPQVTG